MLKKVLSLIITTVFIVTAIMPAVAQENNDLKQILTLDELQDLATKNSRAVLKMDLQVLQGDKQERIYKDDYKKAQYGSSMDIYRSISNTENTLTALQAQKETETNATILKSLDSQISMMSSTLYSLEAKRSGHYSTIKQLKVLKENAEDTNEDLERTQMELEKITRYQTAQLAFNIIELQDMITVLEKNYDQFLRLVEIEKVKEQLGMAVSTDVEMMRVNAADFDKQLKLSKSNYQVLIRTMNDMLGRNPETTLEIVKFNVAESVIPTPGYEAVIEEVLNNTYELYKMDREIKDLEDDLDDTDGSHEEAIAEAEVEKSKLDREAKLLDVQNKLKSVLANYDEKAKEYRLAILNHATAEKQYDWARKKYNLGMVSFLQFHEAEINYLTALNSKTKAGYAYYLAKDEFDMVKQGIFIQ